MKELGTALDIPIHVYGPETHMTAIVAMALGQEPIEDPQPTEVSTGNFLLPSMSWDTLTPRTPQPEAKLGSKTGTNDLFTKKTRCLIYGRQFKACQGMLDFDYVCTREQPSVAGMVDPFRHEGPEAGDLLQQGHALPPGAEGLPGTPGHAEAGVQGGPRLNLAGFLNGRVCWFVLAVPRQQRDLLELARRAL